jgi:hypothetical protein
MNPRPPLGELGSAALSGMLGSGGRHQGDAADRVEVNGFGHTEPLRSIGRIGEDSGEFGAPEGLSGRITALWSFSCWLLTGVLASSRSNSKVRSDRLNRWPMALPTVGMRGSSPDMSGN